MSDSFPSAPTESDRRSADRPDRAPLPSAVRNYVIDGLSGLSRTGKFRDKDNLNRRVIGPVQLAAGELLGARKLAPLPTRLSEHVFRRTYITLVAEAGDLSFTFKSGEDPIGLE
jgi:hypothetical protein